MPLLRAPALRVLDDRDLPAVRALLTRDPVADVFIASRVATAGLSAWRLGAEVWGYVHDAELRALCYAGANLVPVQAGPDAIRVFADRARRHGRHCSSIVGPAAPVLDLWSQLAPHWGPPREVRRDQPLLVLPGAPLVAPDPEVRPVRPEEVELLLPAAVAMFTEEVGVSPLGADGGVLYRARVAELVRTGRAFARIESGRVVFKAEIGSVAGGCCQIQGVWVDPERRGEGLSAAGTAAVVQLARARLAATVSLYVNAFNVPARRAYGRVGFRQVGTFASVLF